MVNLFSKYSSELDNSEYLIQEFANNYYHYPYHILFIFKLNIDKQDFFLSLPIQPWLEIPSPLPSRISLQTTGQPHELCMSNKAIHDSC